MPGTATELRVNGSVQRNVIPGFQDTGFAYPN